MSQNVTVTGQAVAVSSTEGDTFRLAQTQNTAAGANQFDTMTLTQILNWLDANITDANTKTAFKYIARLLKYIYTYEKREGMN